MPLFLVRVRRNVKSVEYGDFSIEAETLAEATTKATSELRKVDITWEGQMGGESFSGLKIEEIEPLATGTEDIREHFD